jgi:HPt (histidine-containing phosphotransfer) domain-containing protein
LIETIPENESMAGTPLEKNMVSQSRAEPRGRPIDLVFLARQTLGDPGLEAEILSLFSRMTEVYLARVTDEATDMDALKHGLHSLKGAAAGVGARAVATEAAAAEAELRDTGKLGAERLSDLTIAVEEVQVFISGLLAE